VYEFLEEDRIIPFLEAAIRVFDRYGERKKRMKARMKFLVKKLGLEAFLELVDAERPALKRQRARRACWPISQNRKASTKKNTRTGPANISTTIENSRL